MKPTPILSLPADYAPKVAARIRTRSQETPTGCIEWSGTVKNDGYGKIKLRHGGRTRTTGPHRAAWLSMVGPIPEGLQIDHLCRNRLCVNINHLEVVTCSVNVSRADHSGKKGRSGTIAGQQIHSCGKHGRDDGYLRTQRDGYTRWECRICRRARMQAYRARQAAA
jgi:hypothetical protein